MGSMKTYQPTNQELIRWVGTYADTDQMKADGYQFGIRTPVAGEVVVVRSHGRYRRGIVTKVGQVNAHVVLTTPSAIEEFRTQRYSARPNLTRSKAGGPVPFKWVAGAVEHAEMADGGLPPGPGLGLHPTLDPETRTELSDDETPTQREQDLAELATLPDRGIQVESVTYQVDRDQLDKAMAELDARRQERQDAAGGGALVVLVLERVWTAIRGNHPELPELVIVTGSGWVGSPRWGHTRKSAWTDRQAQEVREGVSANVKLAELFVAGEALTKGAAFTLETMLHEAAHVLAEVRGVQDTSRQNRWHNQKFRQLAEELGLEYPRDAAHPIVGFSECVLTPGTREEYEEVITELDAALRLTVDLPGYLAAPPAQGEDAPAGGEYVHHGGRRPRQQGGSPNTNSAGLRATCACEEPRIIRASRKVLEEAEIVCGRCREPFTSPELADGD